jgi:hypothetical protein
MCCPSFTLCPVLLDVDLTLLLPGPTLSDGTIVLPYWVVLADALPGLMASSPPQVDLGLTKTLMDSPPGQEVKRRGILMTGESGIFTPEDVAFVQAVGGS